MNSTLTQGQCQIENSLLKVLLYFELFSHPLTAAEIYAYARTGTTNEVKETLKTLVERGLIFEYEGFYMTQNQPNWVSKRRECNRRADEYLPIAQQKARFIASFPFVRAVFVSGSLSKHSMSAESDIDFFIITKAERLWLSRTLMMLYKKVFLFNSHKYFCINYFIDTNHLEIEEKNQFTATETVTLLPMYGQEWYDAFHQANQWAYELYPHFPKRKEDLIISKTNFWWKNTCEWLLSGWLGEQLDTLAMRLTVWFWKRKFSDLDSKIFDVALKSRKYVSKHHPQHFQHRVLNALEEKWVAMQKKRNDFVQ
jgi:hypothetical protein